MNKQILASESPDQKPADKARKRPDPLRGSLLALAGVLVMILFYFAGVRAGSLSTSFAPVSSENADVAALTEQVLPAEGVELPVVWGELGEKLVTAGAIDEKKFRSIYESRGTFGEESKRLLAGENPGRLKITSANAGYLLNLFWALGLANRSPILDSGEMQDPKYGGAGNFASTGGWTLAQGNAMGHYSRHELIKLTAEQQALVEKVSKGIYRPCCGNSTHFPDCNHGMAMLGLLELMAAQNVSEDQMWKAALAVNAYWFPDAYLTLASYMQSRGVAWTAVDPQAVLGADFSSAQGYRNIAASIAPAGGKNRGGSCGV